MTAPIKAIETSYGGCRFRSRLEARWAVFFDALAVPWHYEPQGWLVASGTPYLPDFWLPHQNLFYEVKGVAPEGPSYTAMLEEFAAAQRRRVVMAVGDIPRPDSHTVDCEPPFFMEVFYPDGWDNYHAWCCCDDCGSIDVQYQGWADRNCSCKPGGKHYGAHDPDILAAYASARSARFEHGEAGR